MRTKTIISEIASVLQAIDNCRKMGNNEWLVKHEETIHHIERNLLPSGSGIDSGTRIDRDASNATKIVLLCSFHHMDEHGGYDGWTEHKIIVRPAFDSIDLSISGRNRNDIKSYLAEVYHYCLTSEFVPLSQNETIKG